MTWLLSLLGIPSIIAAVIGFATAALTIFAPIFTSAWQLLTAGIRWLWLNLWWPGIKGAFDGLPQILVIAQLVGVGVLFYLNASTQLERRGAELQQCRNDLTKAKKPVARSPQSPPLLDPFGWFKLP